MALASNLFRAASSRISALAAALAALARLSAIGLRAAIGGGGSIADRLKAALTTPAAQRLVFAALRALAPNLLLKARFVKAYDNTGTALVTRFCDVK